MREGSTASGWIVTLILSKCLWINMDKAIVKRAFQVFTGLGLMAAAFFIAAGRMDILRAWFVYGLFALQLIVNFIVFKKYAPNIARLRSEVKPGTKTWDIVFAIGYALSLLAIHAVAGLDLRFGWSYLDLSYGALGVVLYVIGTALITWAMITNPYFETTVTVVKGQKVISNGPYAFVRHPGYVGMILMYLSSSLILGSAVSLIPGVILVSFIVARIYLEEKTLKEELTGYKEYTKKTKYRLIPFVW